MHESKDEPATEMRHSADGYHWVRNDDSFRQCVRIQPAASWGFMAGCWSGAADYSCARRDSVEMVAISTAGSSSNVMNATWCCVCSQQEELELGYSFSFHCCEEMGGRCCDVIPVVGGRS